MKCSAVNTVSTIRLRHWPSPVHSVHKHLSRRDFLCGGSFCSLYLKNPGEWIHASLKKTSLQCANAAYKTSCDERHLHNVHAVIYSAIWATCFTINSDSLFQSWRPWLNKNIQLTVRCPTETCPEQMYCGLSREKPAPKHPFNPS